MNCRMSFCWLRWVSSWLNILGFYTEGTICYISVVLVRIIILRLQEMLLTQFVWIPVIYEIVISGHDVEGEIVLCIS
jgi:hypothetical protein